MTRSAPKLASPAPAPPSATASDDAACAQSAAVRQAVDEASLVQAARQGDRAAFARLHQQYAPMVHGIALARVPAGDAADLTQEAFMHAIDRLPVLRDPSAFGPWLATIARNLAIEFHRHRRLRLHLELPDKIPDRIMNSTNATTSDSLEQAKRLLAIVRTLPESYAETLVLRLVEGLSGPQIAACTGMTHGSVRVNLNRGMALLRERMREMNLALEDSP